MLITLINFRCYKNKTFTFTEHQMTRIAGETEAGKSTIMEAIYWVLYGKVRDVQDMYSENKQVVQVTLKFSSPNITIFRQSNPGLLQITINKNNNIIEAVGDIAQSHINNIFGDNILWLTSCYIQQKSRCAFLNSSNKEKTKLLNLLSFQEQDSRKIIERIQEEHKESKNNLQNMQISYQTEVEIFNQNAKERNYNPQLSQYTPEQIQIWADYLITQQQGLEQLQDRFNKEQQKRGKLNELREQLSDKESQLQSLKSKNLLPVIEEEKLKLQNHEQEVGKLSVQQPLNIELKQILSKINELQNLLHNELLNRTITLDDIFVAREHTTKHQKEYLPQKQLVDNIWQELNDNQRNFKEKITNVDIRNAHAYEDQYQQYLKLEKECKQLMDQWQSDTNRSMVEWTNFLGVQWTWEIYNQSQTHMQLYQEQYLPLSKQLEDIKSSINTSYPNLLSSITYVVSQDLLYKVKDQENKYNKRKQVEQHLQELPVQKLHIKQMSDNWNIEQQQELIKQWDVYNKQSQIEQQINQLTQLVSQLNLDELSNTYSDLTQETIYTWTHNVNTYNNESNVAKQYDLPYAKEQINKYLLHLNKIIKWLNHKDLLFKYSELKAIIGDTDIDVDKAIDQITHTLYTMQLAQNIYDCPHCNKKVRLENGKLVLLDDIPPSPSNYDPLNNKLNNLKQWKDINSKIISLGYRDEEIQEALSSITNNMNKFELEQKYNTLSKFVYPELPPIDIQVANNILSYRNLQTQREQADKPQLTLEEGKLLLQYYQLKNEIINLPTELPSPSSVELEKVMEYQQLESKLKELHDKNYWRPPNVLPHEIKILLEYTQNQEKMKNLPHEPKELSSIDLEGILNYQTQYNILSKYDKYSNLPSYSPEQLQQVYDYQQLIVKRDKLIEQGAQDIDYSNRINELHDMISNMKRDHEQRDKHQQELSFLHESIKSIKSKISEIVVDNNIEIELKTAQEKLEADKKNVDDIKYAKKMDNWYKNLMARNEEIKAKVAEVAALQDLLNAAIEVECKHLQQTVDKINRIMNLILVDLFDPPINAQLKLFKELKSNHKTKAEVNLSIKRRNAEYGKYALLSGGEDDRVSFGMIIALNMISSSPILLLDECFNSLNDEYREVCLHAVQKYLRNKTTLVIIHEANQGWFDEQLDLIK